MAYAQPIAALELPIPVESDYERQAVLSLAQLVRDPTPLLSLLGEAGAAAGVLIGAPIRRRSAR